MNDEQTTTEQSDDVRRVALLTRIVKVLGILLLVAVVALGLGLQQLISARSDIRTIVQKSGPCFQEGEAARKLCLRTQARNLTDQPRPVRCAFLRGVVPKTTCKRERRAGGQKAESKDKPSSAPAPNSDSSSTAPTGTTPAQPSAPPQSAAPAAPAATAPSVGGSPPEGGGASSAGNVSGSSGGGSSKPPPSTQQPSPSSPVGGAVKQITDQVCSATDKLLGLCL